MPAAPRLGTSGMGDGEDNTTTDLEMAEVLPMPPTRSEPTEAARWQRAARPPPDLQLQTPTPSLHTPESPRTM
jgi:hypothetical protein